MRARTMASCGLWAVLLVITTPSAYSSIASWPSPVREVRDDSIPDFAMVDQDSYGPFIRYNAVRMARLSPNMQIYVRAHEVAHIMLGEIRYPNRQAKTRGEARADCVASQMLADSPEIIEEVARSLAKGPSREGYVTGAERAAIVRSCARSEVTGDLGELPPAIQTRSQAKLLRALTKVLDIFDSGSVGRVDIPAMPLAENCDTTSKTTAGNRRIQYSCSWSSTNSNELQPVLHTALWGGPKYFPVEEKMEVRDGYYSYQARNSKKRWSYSVYDHKSKDDRYVLRMIISRTETVDVGRNGYQTALEHLFLLTEKTKTGFRDEPEEWDGDNFMCLKNGASRISCSNHKLSARDGSRLANALIRRVKSEIATPFEENSKNWNADGSLACGKWILTNTENPDFYIQLVLELGKSRRDSDGKRTWTCAQTGKNKLEFTVITSAQ